MVWSIFFGLLLLCGTKYAQCQPSQSNTDQINQMVKALTDLGIKAMQDGNALENKIYSPVGLGLMMGMLNAGARQETKSQIGKYVFNGLPDQLINEYMKSSIHSFTNKRNPSVNVRFANRIYAQSKTPILQDYQNILSSYYFTDAKAIDFGNAEAARKEINAWVEEQTEQNIKDLFPENSLNDAVLLALGAVYHKGTWQNKFIESDTTNKLFFTTETDKVAVPTMSQSDVPNYYFADSQAQVVGLPFASKNKNDLLMYFILPIKRFGLEELVSKMTTEYFQQLIKSGQHRPIRQLDLPKFKLESPFKANELFKKLGVVDMFNPGKADFSGINGGNDLFVSNFTHKFSFAINEEGTRLATGGDGPSTQRGNPVTFLADQPFLFALVDKQTSSILFMGRVAKIQY
jgi:serpin B